MENTSLILSIIASIAAIFTLIDSKNKSSTDNQRTIRYYFGMSAFWGLISVAFFLISLYLIKPLDLGEYRKIIEVLMTSLFVIPFILSLIFLCISFYKSTFKLGKQFVNFIKNLPS